MYLSFRVVKPFTWDGWHFAPNADKRCSCTCVNGQGLSRGHECSRIPGSACICADVECNCICGRTPVTFGGDVWIVPEKHPRLDAMVRNRFVAYDSSLPDGDVLVKDEQYLKLTIPNKGIGHRTRRGASK